MSWVEEKSGGNFQPVDVVTGLDNDEFVEIVSGLKEGMKVVVSGKFLLDSEGELRAEVSRFSRPALNTPDHSTPEQGVKN